MEDIDDAGPVPHDSAKIERFMKYVDVSDPDECWEWTGGRNKKGYGVFALESKKQVRAHRYAYELANGKPPNGMVLHSCDNPPCVNPSHLSDGTHTENMRQMAERKRSARADRHHKARLTEIEVIAINLLSLSGFHSTRDLATMFGMHQSTVQAITSGHLWPDAKVAADAMLAARSNNTENKETA